MKLAIEVDNIEIMIKEIQILTNWKFRSIEEVIKYFKKWKSIPKSIKVFKKHT